MPHAEKRDGKLTGFWYGEVDRRHKGGERFRREGDRRGAPGLAEGDITGRTFASVAAECEGPKGPLRVGPLLVAPDFPALYNTRGHTQRPRLYSEILKVPEPL